MPNNRIGRINSDIVRTLAVLMSEIKDPRVAQGMITVTGAEVTADLKYCKVYLSVHGLENESSFKRGVKSSAGWLRKELARRLNLRSTPELTFVLDNSIARGAHINSILSSLNIKPEADSDSDT